MLERYRRLAPAPHLAVFHTRLGLSVIDAAGGIEQPDANSVATTLIHRTLVSRDGYAARDIAAHDGCVALLTDNEARQLAEVLSACGLGRQRLPADLRADLSAALDTSELVLTRALTSA